jgi:hypothetical protein
MAFEKWRNMNQEILTKEYTLAEVLGAISGYLLVHEGFGRLHELIEWVVGSSVFTHQIPSALPYVVKALVKQFPDFNLDENLSLASDIEILVGALKAGDRAAYIALGMELEKRYGKRFQVAPMQPFDEFEQPALITPNIADKLILVKTSSDEFPDNIDAV